MSAITVLCSDAAHPVNDAIVRWVSARQGAHAITMARKVAEVTEGDLLFLISCAELVRPSVRERFLHTLVIHASDLPTGRGWSPHIWSVLDGDDHLTVALLTADDPVDSGAVFKKVRIELDGTELYDEINEKLFDAELRLMDWAIAHCDDHPPTPQAGGPTFWRRRTPDDGRIDVDKSIAEVFEQLRVADPLRYPAYCDYRGQRYRIRLDKMGPVT